MVKKTTTKTATPAKQTAASPQMVSFSDAVCIFFQKFATFSGVAQRSEYWWVTLFFFLVSLVTMLIPLLNVIISFVFIVPWLALTVRRLHDMGQSGHWLWGYLGFIPLFVFAYMLLLSGFRGGVVFIGLATFMLIGWSVTMFIFMLMPSKFVGNKYRK